MQGGKRGAFLLLFPWFVFAFSRRSVTSGHLLMKQGGSTGSGVYFVQPSRLPFASAPLFGNPSCRHTCSAAAKRGWIRRNELPADVAGVRCQSHSITLGPLLPIKCNTLPTVRRWQVDHKWKSTLAVVQILNKNFKKNLWEANYSCKMPKSVPKINNDKIMYLKFWNVKNKYIWSTNLTWQGH